MSRPGRTVASCAMNEMRPVDHGRARGTVALAASAALLAKVAVACTTSGTNDVRIFTAFARAIGRVGPVGVYGFHFRSHYLYNHGPLTGILLALMSLLASHGIPFTLLIRMPACLADMATSLLVFELSCPRVGVHRARACGIATAASPVLLAVSGFHGNTDPLFVAFALLSAWLLTARQLPVWAGLSLAMALSVKVVPVVVVPALLIASLRGGRRRGLGFVLGLGVGMTALWAGPMLRYPQQVRRHVLEYAGVKYRPWGLPELARVTGLPPHLTALLEGPGRFSAVLLAAALGAWVAWRRPQQAGAAVGLSLAALLLLSTASAAQYLAWAAAGTFVAEFWSALAYNLLAGAFLTELYSRWSGGGLWGTAYATAWTRVELAAGGLVWVSLLAAVVVGAASVLKEPRSAPAPAPDQARPPAASLQTSN